MKVDDTETSTGAQILRAAAELASCEQADSINVEVARLELLTAYRANEASDGEGLTQHLCLVVRALVDEIVHGSPAVRPHHP